MVVICSEGTLKECLSRIEDPVGGVVAVTMMTLSMPSCMSSVASGTFAWRGRGRSNAWRVMREGWMGE